mgnify:CR=1 FL=1|jgi:hypothetical protein|tara:strand:+ start:108 stop:443 length:336 start_codon:yes stop_codon:yes gene_type:complete
MRKEGKAYPMTVYAGILLVWVAVAIWPHVGQIVILISMVGLPISGIVLAMKTKNTIDGQAVPGYDIFDFGWWSAAPYIFGAILVGILIMGNSLHLFNDPYVEWVDAFFRGS